MRRLFPALLAVLGLGLGLGAAGASAAPTGNTVTGSGTTAGGEAFRIDVSSGPNGESPTGTVTIGTQQLFPTELAVEGNSARIFVSETLGGFFIGRVDLVDDPDLLGTVFFNGLPNASALRSGSITISDATPPTPRPTPTVDSAVGSGSRSFSRSSDTYRFDARSGPNGESPMGTATRDVSLGGPTQHYEGPVTCLKVSGRTAIIGVVFDPARSFQSAAFGNPQVPLEGAAIFTAVEAGTGGIVAQYDVTPDVARSCAFTTDFSGLLGGAVIDDATAPTGQTAPTTKADCKKGGFARFGYRNQGACVSAVARRRTPDGSTG